MRRIRAKHALTAVCALMLCFTGGCYHVAGKADTIPKGVQSIAVLPFRNLSTRYKLPDALQQAISRELIARSKFQVVRDKDSADAILDGVINQVMAIPIIFDPATGKATVVQLSVLYQISLTERSTGRVLYRRALSEIHSQYEIALNPDQYFDESSLALNRVSTDLARSVVTGILDDF